MITRQYKKACEYCGATGHIPANGYTTNPFEICPVCNGSKTVLVIETISDDKITINNEILLT